MAGWNWFPIVNSLISFIIRFYILLSFLLLLLLVVWCGGPTHAAWSIWAFLWDEQILQATHAGTPCQWDDQEAELWWIASPDSIKALVVLRSEKVLVALGRKYRGSNRSRKRRKHVGLHDTTTPRELHTSTSSMRMNARKNPWKIDDEIIQSTVATMNVNIATKTNLHKTIVACPW